MTPHRRHRLRWPLLGLFVLVMVGCLVGSIFFAGQPIRRLYERSQADSLLAMAQILKTPLLPLVLVENRWADAEALAQRLGADAGVRITLLLPDGTVIADSEEEPARMGNHGDRPEIRQAILERRGDAVRPSETLGTRMLYVATPLHHGGRMIGVLRLALPLAPIDDALAAHRRLMLRNGLLVTLATALLGLLVVWVFVNHEERR
ncbi:MAG TPA: hypothetical protein PLS90_05175 [Candidatus Sumerlaeota bacterium]|nr:hypothetical protein [Candidatus Sumerlaeota bacterium]HOR27421.1 hypothetical protein [Candidatus Sumerlaeota bacterium]HPK01828.1 hypothetical protein [Candidatus Sumerlaeota bacterium]